MFYHALGLLRGEVSRCSTSTVRIKSDDFAEDTLHFSGIVVCLYESLIMHFHCVLSCFRPPKGGNSAKNADSHMGCITLNHFLHGCAHSCMDVCIHAYSCMRPYIHVCMLASMRTCINTSMHAFLPPCRHSPERLFSFPSLSRRPLFD